MREYTVNRSVQILLVEDSESDIEMTIEALRDAKVLNELYVVRDGVEAMAYLRKEGPYAKENRPDLVLLDLNMPRMDGREVLEAMDADPKLKVIPVVVLTTSASDVDVLHSYKLNAAAYISKPVDFSQFVETMRKFRDFWLDVVRLPPKDAHG
jgi:two-component system, chemotaxis family, response regulator Rcp1